MGSCSFLFVGSCFMRLPCFRGEKIDDVDYGNSNKDNYSKLRLMQNGM